MSNNIVSLIERLPNELIHRIFDNLDAETIIFSIRPVSKLFQSIVNCYDRYIFDFNLISKSKFYVLCRLINPHNVISLTFSNDQYSSGQIAWFISLVRLEEFIRLRSLTLFNINDRQLKFISQRINLNSITSFSFNTKKYSNTSIETITNLFSTIIAKPSLRKLEFNICDSTLSMISWPINCTIEYLIINTFITMDNLSRILHCSPHLHTLIMSKMLTGMMDNSTSICFPQITSLTIEKLDVTIDKVESFLLMTPSLIYLKLIDGDKMLDGKRWEEFIKINLPKLDKFEFYFTEWKAIKPTQIDLKLIISSFQSPFWIKHKKWFVTYEYTSGYMHSIELYSVPICKSSMCYTSTLKRISLSTYPITTNENLSISDNIKSFNLDWNKSIAADIQEKKATANHPLFPKLSQFNLHFSEAWPLLSLQSLSIFIDISRIVYMMISSDYFETYKQNTWLDIGIFMEQAHNLSSLIIQRHFDESESDRTIENIHSIVPRHVKHLQTSINNVNQIDMILERCKHLSRITLYNNNKKLVKNIINWFANNTTDTSCREGHGLISVWIGKKKNLTISNTY